MFEVSFDGLNFYYHNNKGYWHTDGLSSSTYSYGAWGNYYAVSDRQENGVRLLIDLETGSPMLGSGESLEINSENNLVIISADDTRQTFNKQGELIS